MRCTRALVPHATGGVSGRADPGRVGEDPSLPDQPVSRRMRPRMPVEVPPRRGARVRVVVVVRRPRRPERRSPAVLSSRPIEFLFMVWSSPESVGGHLSDRSPRGCVVRGRSRAAAAGSGDDQVVAIARAASSGAPSAARRQVVDGRGRACVRVGDDLVWSGSSSALVRAVGDPPGNIPAALSPRGSPVRLLPQDGEQPGRPVAPGLPGAVVPSVSVRPRGPPVRGAVGGGDGPIPGGHGVVTRRGHDRSPPVTGGETAGRTGCARGDSNPHTLSGTRT